MLKVLWPILTVALVSGAVAQDASSDAPNEAITLAVLDGKDVIRDDFLWLNRMIVVFADSELDPSFQEQLDLLLERPNPLIDRDVVVITDTDRANPSALRMDLRPRGFGFVLIDKDGVIKLRKPSPWDVREITRSIDKTELRQQELIGAREAR